MAEAPAGGDQGRSDMTILPRSASAGVGSAAPAVHLPPGFRLGAYTVTRTLGEGGYGVVYEAEQLHPVRRTVAIKLLKPGMDTAEVLIRFEGERQALARMDHPSVARVLDAGVAPDGRPFFAMEYVRGEPMLLFVDRERLGIPERIAVAIQVCEAIQHAHAKGVVHRDLKPANILCARVDGRVVPKVIDFGIAKATTDRLGDSAMVTVGGELMGTPDYMSPEQADGRDIDTRADVYSLGATFYELFSGLLPFDPQALRSRGITAMRDLILHEAPPRPSARLSGVGANDRPLADRLANARGASLDHLVRRLRDDLDWICLRCLEKDRDRRYASPSELGADLRRHVARLPVTAGPPSRAYAIRKFVSRHRLWVAAASAAVVALAVAAAVFASLYRSAEEQRRLAADTLDAFQQSIAAVDPSGGRANASMGALDFLGLVEDELGSRLESQPDALATMRQALAVARISFKDGSGAGRLLDAVVAHRRAALEAAPGSAAGLALAEALHNQGRARYYEARYEDALTAYREALELRRRGHAGRDHADVAMTLQHLAATERRLGRLDEAMALIDGSVAMWGRLDPQSRERYQAVNNRGTILEQAGRPEEAERDYLDALAVLERIRGADDPLVARTLINVAGARRKLGRAADAVAPLERAVRIYELRFGAEHPDTEAARAELDLAMIEAGRAR